VLLVILKGEGSFGILVLNWIGVGFGGGNSVVGKSTHIAGCITVQRHNVSEK
jgi:hypothetical protein